MKSKKLNLEEVWKIYLLLRPAIEGRNPEVLVVDEIDKIIELSTPEVLLECIHVMYDNKVKFNNGLEFELLFANGIIQSKFLEFCEFIRGLNGSSK